MQALTNHLQQIWRQAKEYFETRLSIAKLKFTDVIGGLFSNVIVFILIFIASLFFLMLTSIGTAVWINYRLASSFAGFLWVGAFYGIACLILFGLRKRLFRYVLTRHILRKLMKLQDGK